MTQAAKAYYFVKHSLVESKWRFEPKTRKGFVMNKDVKELEEVKDVFDDASPEGTEPSSVLTDYSAAFDVLESGYDGEATTTREILAVPIGRPNSQTFFQIHPELENWSKLVLIFRDRSDVRPGEIDRGETYFCHPSLENVLGTEVARKRIYTLITRFGDLWFWPVKPLGVDSPTVGPSRHIG